MLALGREITAFGLGHGAPRWSVEPPADGGTFCGTSSVPVGGKVALAYTEGPDPNVHGCRNAALLDIASGTLLWRQPVEMRKAHRYPEGAMLDIVEDTVVIGAESNLAGLAVADGQQRWERTGEIRETGVDGCVVHGLVPRGDTVIVGQQCDGATYAAVDPGTGDVLAEQTYSEVSNDAGKTSFLESPALIESDPLVTQLNVEADTALLAALGDDLTIQKFIQTPGSGSGSIDLRSRGFGGPYGQRQPPPVLATENALYITTMDATGENQLRAYSYDTGDPLWTLEVPDTKFLEPVTFEDGQLVAIAETRASGDHLLQVVHVEAAEGVVTNTSEGSRLEDTTIDYSAYRYHWLDGRVVGVLGLMIPPKPAPVIFSTTG